MKPILISRTQILQHSGSEVFGRGEQYARSGAVRSLIARGDTLEARVEGSEYEPYRVQIGWDAAGITSATCTCPYDWGGWCKHIVATLLVYLQAPSEVEERPTLLAQLAELDAEQREALLRSLASDQSLTDLLERHLAQFLFQQSQQAAPDRRAWVNVEAFRRDVQDDLFQRGPSYTREYYDEWDSSVSLEAHLAKIRPYVEGGEGANALSLLEVLTDELIGVIAGEQLYAESFESRPLDSLWTEALLMEPLSPAERKAWREQFLQWDEVLNDYGMDGSLGGAQLAAEQGWEGEILERWRRGEALDEETWDGDEDKLDLARLGGAVLRILDRRGEHETFLNVARATGAGAAYLTRLVALGRSAQAVKEAAQWLRQPDEALALAQALREQGELEGALRIGEHGLSLHPTGSLDLDSLELWQGHPASRHAMATWLADLAEGMGRREVALRASEIAFRDQPSVAGYDRVRALAGDAWESQYHDALLQHLRGGVYAYAETAVDIFLREGLLEDAMQMAAKSALGTVLHKVMGTVIHTHPDWVIQQALRRGEPIMDSGDSAHYDDAVAWLRHARDAYLAADRADEWQRYLADLKARHGRKYKLMGLMKGL